MRHRSKSKPVTLGQKEPRIFTDATDRRGLSVTIRSIRLNPRFLLYQSHLFRFSASDGSSLAEKVVCTAQAQSGGPGSAARLVQRRFKCIVLMSR